ncbi:MAG TPA: DUF1249 domain-containing protein [Gammaproteobacteria bacterium]
MDHILPHYPIDSSLWLFEENYRLLLELLSLDGGEGGVLRSALQEDERLEISVVERSRYTLTLALRKSLNFGKAWVPDILMEARLYLDARVAEVLSYQNCRRLPAPYAVRGSVPFHKDEKRQANRLLNDLLEHCLRQGFHPAGAAA